MGLLGWLGPRPARLVVVVLTGERELVVRPDLLAGQDVLADHGPALRVGQSVVAHLLHVPAVADAEDEPPARDHVEAGHLLRKPQRIPLGHERDAGGQLDRLRGPGHGGESHELVVAPPVLLGQRGCALPATPGGLTARRDVAVLREPDRLEASGLSLHPQLHGLDRLVGREDHHADFHGGTSIRWRPTVGDRVRTTANLGRWTVGVEVICSPGPHRRVVTLGRRSRGSGCAGERRAKERRGHQWRRRRRS